MYIKQWEALKVSYLGFCDKCDNTPGFPRICAVNCWSMWEVITLYSQSWLLTTSCPLIRPQLRWRRGWQSSSTATPPRAFCHWPTGSSASSTTRWLSWPETAWPNHARASSPVSTSVSCRRTWRSCCMMWVADEEVTSPARAHRVIWSVSLSLYIRLMSAQRVRSSPSSLSWSKSSSSSYLVPPGSLSVWWV